MINIFTPETIVKEYYSKFIFIPFNLFLNSVDSSEYNLRSFKIEIEDMHYFIGLEDLLKELDKYSDFLKIFDEPDTRFFYNFYMYLVHNKLFFIFKEFYRDYLKTVDFTINENAIRKVHGEQNYLLNFDTPGFISLPKFRISSVEAFIAFEYQVTPLKYYRPNILQINKIFRNVPKKMINIFVGNLLNYEFLKKFHPNISILTDYLEI